jgi:hypothetical protein
MSFQIDSRIARSLTACVVALLAAASGCGSWSNWTSRGEHAANSAKPLPLKKVSRTVELETRFLQLQLDPAKPDQLQSVWQWVDETVIPIPKRNRLSSNGLRIGKVIRPERLTRRLESLHRGEAGDIVDEFLASAAISSHQSEGKRTIPLRLGKRHELPVRLPIEGPQVVLIDDQPQPIGRTLADPQFLFAVTPAEGDSALEVRLRMRPEIQHGDMRQDWVPGEAALRIDVRRQSWSLDDLEFELSGGEGDLFLLGQTAPRKGLGEQMFGGTDVDQLEQQTVLLLRIANVPTPAEKL